MKAMGANADIVKATVDDYRIPNWVYEKLRLKFLQWYAQSHRCSEV